MQEIIIYAVLTLIVGAMLYSVLGKDVGEGSEVSFDPQDMLDKLGTQKQAAPSAPKFDGPAKKGLTAIYQADPTFNLGQFIEGAKSAYGMILEAYADGDKKALDGLLNKQVKASYFAAIDERESKNLNQTTDLARLMSAEIIGASKTGKKAIIQVVYEAELATALVNKDGDVVEGDLDVLSRVKEIWGYERLLTSKNPNWILSAVEPHIPLSGDDAGPDHSPDHPSDTK